MKLPEPDSDRQQLPERFVEWCTAHAAADTDQGRRARVAAWLAELRAVVVPFHTFARDRAARDRDQMTFTRDTPADRLAHERAAAAHLAFRELFEGLRRHRLLILSGPQRQRYFDTHVEEWVEWHAKRTAALVREMLGSDELRRRSAEVPLEDELFEDAQPERRAVPLDEAVASRLDAAARLEVLAEMAPPGERTFLAAWRLEPDASIAEIASRLGIAASTARTLVQRLRTRAASL
jgi:hypothetical protein